MPTIDERQRVRDRLSAVRLHASAGRAPGPPLTGAGPADVPAGTATAQDAPGSPGREDGAARSASVAPAPEWLTPPAAPRSRWIPSLDGARFALGWRAGVTLAVFGIATAIVTALAVWCDRPVSAPAPPLAVGPAAPSARSASPPAAELVVSVAGLVRRPGLVRVSAGARVADALAAAGGPVDGADMLSLNLAARVSDGEQLVVPARGQAPPPAAGPPRPPAGGGKVDLNAASPEQLNALPGVGPVTVTAIVAWRTRNGRFTSVDQLGEVDGIGPARLARLRTLVTV